MKIKVYYDCIKITINSINLKWNEQKKTKKIQIREFFLLLLKVMNINLKPIKESKIKKVLN